MLKPSKEQVIDYLIDNQERYKEIFDSLNKELKLNPRYKLFAKEIKSSMMRNIRNIMCKEISEHTGLSIEDILVVIETKELKQYLEFKTNEN